MLIALAIPILVPVVQMAARRERLGFPALVVRPGIPCVGELVVRNSGELVVPMEPFQKLTLIENGEVRLISSLTQLRGKVRIDTAEDALRFVRLGTSPRTFYMLRSPRAWEVLPISKYRAQWVFSDPLWNGMIASNSYENPIVTGRYPYYQSGFYGVVGNGWWKRSGLSAPITTPTATGWRIRRTLVRQGASSDAPPKFFDATENVGRDGSYTLSLMPRNIPPVLLNQANFRGMDWE